MFRVCAFVKADVSPEYTAFRAAFGLDSSGDDSGGEEEPNEPDEPGVTTYTVTSALTNVESTNATAVVNEGASYTATLTAVEGHKLDSVTVTMGGSDVTSKVYADGVVNISAVDGDVVVTASAVVSVVAPTILYQMPTPTTFDGTGGIDTGVALFDDGSDWTMLIDCICESSLNDCLFEVYGDADNYFNILKNYNNPAFKTTSKFGGAWGASCSIDVTDTGKCVFAVVYKDGVAKIYTGTNTAGAKVGANMANNSATLHIAEKTTATTNTMFNGTINTFIVYDGALSGSEILAFLGV